MTEQKSPEKLSPRERAFRLLDQLRNERKVTLAIFGLMIFFVVGVQIMLSVATYQPVPEEIPAIEEQPEDSIAPQASGRALQHDRKAKHVRRRAWPSLRGASAGSDAAISIVGTMHSDDQTEITQ